MRKHLRKFAFLALLVLILALLLLPGPGIKAAHADTCTFGDIICDMKTAIEQIIDPLKDWTIFTGNAMFYGVIYQILHVIASALWSLSKGLITVGVGIGVVSNWVSTHFFQPMITLNNSTFSPVIGVVLMIALGLLGITYAIASFIKLNVVSPKSMILWYFVAAVFFQVGPSFYAWMDNFRQTAFTFFYGSSLTAMQGQSPFQTLASGDTAQNSAIYGMPNPCSNFSLVLPGSGGNLNGMDISLAYQKADGYDVVTGGMRCMGGGQQTDIPRAWLLDNGFFDQKIAPNTWQMPPAGTPLDTILKQMSTSDTQAFAGISRLFDATPLVWFAIVEQIVGLCLMIAQGLTFLSFAVALLFAFFKRTEAIAWSIIDQWIGLLIQTIVIAISQAMIVALYISAAQTGSPLITLAVSVAGLVIMTILLVSGAKAVWNAFNRLFAAFGQATGGAIITPGQAAVTTMNAGGMALGGAGALGAGVVGAGMGALGAGTAVMGGLNALGDGATLAQAAGITLGDNNAFTGAANTIYRLPGLRGSPMADAADQFLEGARLQAIGDALPGGSILGPLVGAKLLTNRDPSVRSEDGQMPMLNDGMESWVVNRFTTPRNPRLYPIEPDDAVAANTANETRIANGPNMEGEFLTRKAVRAQDEADMPDSIEVGALAGSNADDFNARIAEDVEEGEDRAAADSATARRGEKDPQQGDSALREGSRALEEASRAAGRSLTEAATELQRGARQQGVKMYEGSLTAKGDQNVAAVMGDLVAALALQRAEGGPSRSHQSPTNNAVAEGMAQAMGLTSLGDGKLPVTKDLGRFQMYADQALKMGLTGDIAERSALDVKDNGGFSPQTRELIQQATAVQHPNWNVERVQRETDNLQSRAAMLPEEIHAVGAMSKPIARPPTPKPSIDEAELAAEIGQQQARSLGVTGRAATTAYVAEQPQSRPATLPMPTPPSLPGLPTDMPSSQFTQQVGLPMPMRPSEKPQRGE